MMRPSPALIISLIALVFAATGTGWAVTQLPRNSVGTTQLKNNAVVSSKVKDGSLRATDFATGQLPAGATGATGPRGPSNAYWYNAGGVALGLASTSMVSSETLPAGSYTLIGRVNLTVDGLTNSAGVVCTAATDFIQTDPLVAGARVPLTLASATTLTEPGTIAVSCRRVGGTAVMLESGTLIITRVESLTAPAGNAG